MKPLEKYFPIFQKALGNYQTSHPYWRLEVLTSLMRWGLVSLRHYIEDPHERNITWDNPFVQLHYPVQWNWTPRTDGEVARGGHIHGKFTAENTATEELAKETLAKIMAHWFNATALADLTNWAWYEHQNNYSTPVLPVELSAQLNAIADKRERRECFDTLVQPYSIGGATIETGDVELREGDRIPKHLAKRLADLSGTPRMQPFTMSGEINGRKIEMRLFFEIHPLIADYDKQKAYHPITIGLFIEPDLTGRRVVTRTPADWPKCDREKLWHEMLQAYDRAMSELISKTVSGGSIILDVNATIKIPAERWSPNNRSAVIKQIADVQSQAGDLLGITVEVADGNPKSSTQPACVVCGWMHDLGFRQIKVDNGEIISLRGVLPEIVRVVHEAHEKEFTALSTKDDELLKTCRGYGNPCKAFDDLKRRAGYKLLFDTSRRGFIALRGAVGRNRNKSEPRSE